MTGRVREERRVCSLLTSIKTRNKEREKKGKKIGQGFHYSCLKKTMTTATVKDVRVQEPTQSHIEIIKPTEPN